MKKLVTLLAAAGMLVSAAAPASAVDVKVDARYRFSFQTGETGFGGMNEENVNHRLRLGLTFAASENLSGYANFQFGTEKWGTTNDTNGHKEGDTVQTRMIYIDWKVPATSIKVRMGRQNIGLPADAFGDNGVISGSWGTKDGIALTAPVTDWLGLSAMWVRVASDATGDVDTDKNDDLFGVAANLKFNGVSGSVYGAYAALDGSGKFGVQHENIKGANFEVTHGNAWWIGATATVSYFDPFTLKLSAAYGSFESSLAKTDQPETSGWNVQAKASYKTAFGTPVLGAWYFSGNDKDGDGLMPSLGGYFRPTRAYHDGAPGLNGGIGLGLPSGNWGVQAGIEKVSFLQGLTHDFLVTYIEGTNDSKWTPENSAGDSLNYWYLTEDDSLVSFDLINTYQIYKNLAAHLQLSYILSDFEAGDATTHKLNEDDWAAELTFEYKF